jgi:phenylacetate-CoA ligase
LQIPFFSGEKNIQKSLFRTEKKMNWRKNIVYPLICLKNKSSHLRYLRELEKSQFFSAKAMYDLQNKRFLHIVKEAFTNVPYYSATFENAGTLPENINGLKDITKLPTLSRKNIQENLVKLVSKNFDINVLIKDKTGGSTGSPINFYYDEERLDWRKASVSRHDRWAGLDIGVKHAVLWGARNDLQGFKSVKSKIYSFLTTKGLVLDASAINGETLDRFTHALYAFRPTIILAYARTLSFYARYLKEAGIMPPSPHAIVTSAELLTDEDRILIEDVFKSHVFNRYGCREFSMIASECAHGTMHINDECLYIEFVRPDGSVCEPGEEGEIVITDLLNTAMPMIRYRIGDIGMLINEKCPCGRGLRIMKMTSGRVTDFLISSTGTRVSGVAIATYVITNITGINQVQFIQKKKGEVTVLVVKNTLFDQNKTLQELERNIKAFLEDTRIDITIVDTIPLAASGKMQFCINTISKP